MRATKFRGEAHARILARWLDLPTYQALSPVARCILVAMLARYRPGENGRLEWPARRAAEEANVSRATAARALVALERNGWVAVTRPARFGGAHDPARYRLTMFDCEETGQPATHDYAFLPGERLETGREASRSPSTRAADGGSLVRQHSIAGEQSQSHQRATARHCGEAFPGATMQENRPENNSLEAGLITGGNNGPKPPDTAIDIISCSEALRASILRMKPSDKDGL